MYIVLLYLFHAHYLDLAISLYGFNAIIKKKIVVT